MKIEQYLVYTDATIREAITAIDANRGGAVVVVDKERRLVGVATDGDVRRAILDNVELSKPVTVLLERRPKQLYPVPVSAPVDLDDAGRLCLMQKNKIRHLPIVSEDNKVVEFVLLDRLLGASDLDLTAVVMAGGYGKRLHPLTETVPKPMLPVQGKPLLERLIQRLREDGIRNVHVTTNYKGEHITQHFGDGNGFGVEMGYVAESEPLGTAGSLRLLDPPKGPFLVINGDILTKVNFRSMLAFHLDHEAEMTVAVRQYTVEVPYGVIDVNGMDVLGVQEKPCITSLINAGIYLLNPSVLEFIPKSEGKFDMTTLINMLVAARKRVVSFPVREYWLDIGHIDDYERAQADVGNGRF